MKLIGDLCGYIYVTTNKSFIHYCKFCEKLFGCWQDFQDHNITEHFENNLQKQIKINFIPILSQNDGLHNKSKESGLFQDRNILELDDEKLQIKENSDLNDYNTNESTCSENSVCKVELTEISEKSCEFKDSEDVSESDEESDSQSSTNHFSNADKTLRCTFCSKLFRKELNLKEHTKEHLNYSLTCEFCGKHWKRKYELERHKKIHFEIKCEDNSTETENYDLQTELTEIKKHEDGKSSEFKHDKQVIQGENRGEESDSQISINHFSNKEENFCCKFCSKRFMGKDNLDEHIKKHLNYSLTCEICEKHWKTEYELQRHKKMHFEIKCDNVYKETENSDGEIEFGEIEKLDSDAEISEFRNDKRQAENSGEECDTPISNNHLSNEVDNLSCTYCFKQFTKKTCLEEHIKNHLNFKLSCDICGKHFKVKNDLQRHKTSHLRVKCIVCEYSCWPEQLDEHMKTHENEDENLRCTFCRQQFSNKANLDEHTKRHFNYSLTCEICGKHFKRKHDLMCHKETHFKIRFSANGETYTDNSIRESELAEIRELEKKSELKGFSNETLQNENSDKGLNSEISFFHRCEFCTDKFSDKFKFDEHMQNHLNNSLACDICGKHWKTKNNLRRHKIIHLKVKCSLCEYSCFPDQLDKHMEKHNQANENDSLRCTFCHQKFCKKTNLDEHTKLHLNYILTCKICGKHSKEQRELWRHKKTHLRKNCSICKLSFPRGQFENHMKGHKILQCKYCSKIFKFKFRLDKHLRIHTGERPFQCEACPLAFAEKSNLTKHVYTAHTGDEKKFTCELCQRKFKTKQLRDMHYRRVHLKEKPHICEFCGRSFAGSGQLLVHTRKHHIAYDKRPYPCNMCDKKYVELINLKEHMNTHTGERPFQCEICLKGFSSKKSLRGHKILHTDERHHVCKICGKAYAQRSSCANHMKQQHMIDRTTKQMAQATPVMS